MQIPQPFIHIVTGMLKKIKWIDWGMVFIFVLWLASTDIHNMNWWSVFTGVFVIAYLIFYAVRRVKNR